MRYLVTEYEVNEVALTVKNNLVYREDPDEIDEEEEE